MTHVHFSTLVMRLDDFGRRLHESHYEYGHSLHKL